MSKMPLDLSKFKKVKEDEKSAHLQHPDGHTVMIAKNALSKSMKSALEKMPKHFVDGGDTTPNSDSEPFVPGLLQKAYEYYKSDSEPTKQAPPMFNMEKEANAPMFNMEADAKNNAMLMDQAAKDKAQQAQNAMDFQNGANIQDANGQFKMPNLTPEQMQMIQNNPYLAQNFASGQMSMEGLNQQLKGLNQESAAQALAAKGQIAALDMAQERNNKTVNDFLEVHNRLQNEISKFAEDHKIDPEDYEKHMGTGQTIRTMIGLVLGGAFSGMTGQANPAAVMLNNQIDRNIQAQMKNKDSFLQALNLKFGNMKDAEDMFRSYNLTAAANDFQRAALVAQSPLAKSRALQMSGQLIQQKSDLLGGMAGRQAMLKQQSGGPGQQGSQLDPMTAINFMVPPQDQAKAKEELAQYQKNQQLKKMALMQFDQAYKEQTFGGALARKGESSPALNALNNTLAKMVQDKEKRINIEVLNNLKESANPSKINSREEALEKRKNLEMFSDIGSEQPTLEYYNIVPQTQTFGPANFKLGPLK
jgi:hypothetical protein